MADISNITLLPKNTTFIEAWEKDSDYVPRIKGISKKIISKKEIQYTAIDNSDGNCHNADFNSIKKALIFLKDINKDIFTINKYSSEDENIYTKEFDESEINYLEKHLDFLSVHEFSREDFAKLRQQEFKFEYDDIKLSSQQIQEAVEEKDKIVKPIINGEKTGLWTAFKDFDEKGIFEIIGKKISLTKDNKLTETSMKQLYKAMEIYRSKKFETFRFILVEKGSGTIKNQYAISSFIPNKCSIGNFVDFAKIISKAVKDNCIIIAAHNHPSGNIIPSYEDINSTIHLYNDYYNPEDNTSLFGGHIILDHNSFSSWIPGAGWKSTEYLINNNMEKKVPEWAKSSISHPKDVIEIGKKINDAYNWNDDFIPVVYASNKIRGLQYYNKDFFFKNYDYIKNNIKFEGIECGAVHVYPIFSKENLSRINKSEQTLLENKLHKLVSQGVFCDVIYNEISLMEKYHCKSNRTLFSEKEVLALRTSFYSWDAEIDTELFPSFLYDFKKINESYQINRDKSIIFFKPTDNYKKIITGINSMTTDVLKKDFILAKTMETRYKLFGSYTNSLSIINRVGEAFSTLKPGTPEFEDNLKKYKEAVYLNQQIINDIKLPSVKKQIENTYLKNINIRGSREPRHTENRVKSKKNIDIER